MGDLPVFLNRLAATAQAISAGAITSCVGLISDDSDGVIATFSFQILFALWSQRMSKTGVLASLRFLFAKNRVNESCDDLTSTTHHALLNSKPP
jgi:hypothetical protein